MLDRETNRDKVIKAALELAAEAGWRGLSLRQIADKAGVGLADLRAEFASKTDILKAFVAEVDREVLAKARPDLTEPARDRIFDVVMTRLEVLAPYKAALARLYGEPRPRPVGSAGLVCASLRSQYWMLTAAGIDAEPPAGCVRVPGLLAVYGDVVPIWLADDDPGLARTMAALDRRLRRGERWLARLDAFCAMACSFARLFSPRPGRPAEPRPAPPAEPAAGGNGAAEPSVG